MRPASTACLNATAMATGSRHCNGSIHQASRSAHFHSLCRMARGTDTGIHHYGDIGLFNDYSQEIPSL